MRIIQFVGLVLAVLTLGREAVGQVPENDQNECLVSGGKGWDGTKTEPPRCECRREDNLVNAIVVCGACGKKNPLCDRCVPLGTSDCAKLVRHVQVPARRDPNADCRAACESQRDVARWNPRADKAVRCEPFDPAQYMAGVCSVRALPPVVLEPNPEAFCKAQCAALAPAATWLPNARPEARCEPTDSKKFVAGPCTIAPKGEGDPVLICATICRDSGGKLTNTGCQCPNGKVHENACLCLQESSTNVNINRRLDVHEQPVAHIGAAMRAIGLVGTEGADGLYVPVGFAPSLLGRLHSSKLNADFTVAAGLLITGTGGEVNDTPLGFASAIGGRFYLNKVYGLGLELDFNWYEIDRNHEALAASGGARFLPVVLRHKLDSATLHADLGIGGAYLTPDEMTALVWGITVGYDWPW